METLLKITAIVCAVAAAICVTAGAINAGVVLLSIALGAQFICDLIKQTKSKE